jgi:hypothetical protein
LWFNLSLINNALPSLEEGGTSIDSSHKW